MFSLKEKVNANWMSLYKKSQIILILYRAKQYSTETLNYQTIMWMWKKANNKNDKRVKKICTALFDFELSVHFVSEDVENIFSKRENRMFHPSWISFNHNTLICNLWIIQQGLHDDN